MTEDEEREDWMNAPLGKLMTEEIKDNGALQIEIESLEIRLGVLEEELDKLTDVVKAMSDHLIKSEKEFRRIFERVE